MSAHTSRYNVDYPTIPAILRGVFRGLSTSTERLKNTLARDLVPDNRDRIN
jgi:hypothetical protein